MDKSQNKSQTIRSAVLNVGKIVNTHGVRGDVKVLLRTDFPEARFRKGNRLLLAHPETNRTVAMEVEAARPHKNTYIVKFNELNSINDAEMYKNWLLQVDDSQRVDLEEGEYYFDEIIGCSVFTVDGEELGVIGEILTPGANDVWVVDRKAGKPLLLPVIDDVLAEVDVANKRVTVHLLEGLL